MSDKDTKAGSLMRRLQIIEAADEKRERQVKGWVDALLAAEAAAAAGGTRSGFSTRSATG